MLHANTGASMGPPTWSVKSNNYLPLTQDLDKNGLEGKQARPAAGATSSPTARARRAPPRQCDGQLPERIAVVPLAALH